MVDSLRQLSFRHARGPATSWSLGRAGDHQAAGLRGHRPRPGEPAGALFVVTAVASALPVPNMLTAGSGVDVRALTCSLAPERPP